MSQGVSDLTHQWLMPLAWDAWLLGGGFLTIRGIFFWGGRKCQEFGSSIKQLTANVNHLAETRCYKVGIVTYTGTSLHFSRGSFFAKEVFLGGGLYPFYPACCTYFLFITQLPYSICSFQCHHFNAVRCGPVDSWKERNRWTDFLDSDADFGMMLGGRFVEIPRFFTGFCWDVCAQQEF